MLKLRAEEYGARLHFSSEMVSFDQDKDGVTALIRHRDTGETFPARARRSHAWRPGCSEGGRVGFTEEQRRELLRIGLGAEIPVTIDSIQKWEREDHVAERFVDGRVNLAGDSAHVMPPYGGFGKRRHPRRAEPCVEARDDPERAGELVAPRHVRGGTAPGSGAHGRTGIYAIRAPGGTVSRHTEMQPFVPDPNVDLGYRCHSRAIVMEQGDDGAVHEDPRASKGRPGTRAPHVWIERAGVRASTIDLFGRDFVLLAGPEGAAWTQAARDAGAELGILNALHASRARNSASVAPLRGASRLDQGKLDSLGRIRAGQDG